MGLISGLLTLPLAPVRGTAWLAERIQEQAELELYDEDVIRGQLMELEEARQSGEYDEEEIAAAEDALVERLLSARAAAAEREG
jgi:Gas vesicle protein G